MNYRDIIVFDFETGSRNPYKTQPTQIAAVAIHGRKLTIQPGGIFNSEIRPILDDDKAIEMGLDPIEDEALAVTRKTREELAKAPQLKTVWKKFSNFVNKYNFKKTNWTAPIPAGYNIIGFDMPIVERMCSEHGPTNAKNGRQGLFNPHLQNRFDGHCMVVDGKQRGCKVFEYGFHERPSGYEQRKCS